MIDVSVFITLAIIAATQGIKETFPDKVQGVITIIVAVAIGALVGILDVHIGLPNISVATGIVAGLAGVGIHTTAKQIG